MSQIVSPEERRPVCAGEPRALIGVDEHLALWLSTPNRHEQSLQDDICRLTALHRQANDPPRVKINHDRPISEAFQRPDIRYVGDPRAIGLLNVELAIQRIIDNKRRLASMASRATLVPDPRPDTGLFGQLGNPFRAACLALIHQVVV